MKACAILRGSRVPLRKRGQISMLSVSNKYLEIAHRTLSLAHDDTRTSVQEGDRSGDYTISVVPRNPDAATVAIEVREGSEVSLRVGKRSRFAIRRSGGAAASLAQFQQIESFLKAISHGHFEERFVYVGEKIVGSTGILHLPERDVVTKSGSLVSSFLRHKREVSHIYGPYRMGPAIAMS
jgi:hypothetical protein